MKKLTLIFISSMYCFALSAQNLKPQPEAPNTDGHNLPEVQIHDSKAQASPVQGSNFNRPFYEYVLSVKEKIAHNEKVISMLKATAHKNNRSLTKKEIKDQRSITSLEEYNNELKTELNNYVKYGIGNWEKFKKEFNADLTFLEATIKVLHDEINNGLQNEIVANSR